MKFFVYAVRDVLTGFMTPTLEQNDAVALRNFAMACDFSKRDVSLMAHKPSDFSLFRIASFDSETGVLSPIVPIELVCSGDSLGGQNHG